VVLVGCGGPSEAELALMDAARGGDIEAVKHHLAAGVDVNVIYKGQTPLHYAAAYGHKEIVELLIAKGADVNAKISDGFHKGDTPLDNAKHKPEIVDLLRKHGGKTLYELSIWKAAFGGSIEAIKQHIAAGTDLNAKDTYGWIPLNHAAEGGHKEIIELLIANGADVNAQNVNGYTPLHTAILNDETEIAELLITKGADVNAQTEGGVFSGRTPLYLAVNSSGAETVELLIAGGADVNAKTEVGVTPLHSAATKEIAELLIAAGADVNAKAQDDYTPLDFSIMNKHTKTADLLRKHGGKTGEELKAEGK
jgi:cytohesin